MHNISNFIDSLSILANNEYLVEPLEYSGWTPCFGLIAIGGN